MRILVDTNVVLDLLLARKPFVSDAARIFTMVERGSVEGVLCATTFTTIDYLLGQSLSEFEAREAVWKLLSLFEVAPVNRVVLAAAIESSMRDFEDAILAQSANHSGIERIVTRNTSDFSQSPVIAIDPPEFLAQLTDSPALRKPKG